MPFRNLALAAINPTDLAALQPHLVDVRLSANHVLQEPGEPVTAVYFPNTAVISVVTVMRDGSSVEAATLGYESVVGVLPVLSGGASHARVFVQVAGSAVQLEASHLRERAGCSSELLQSLLRCAQAEMAQAEQSAACIALHIVPQRLARWLLVTDDRIDGATMPLTQEHLSIMLGVQRTTITAAATELKSKGLIDYRRGRIEILDREGLERASCECYAAQVD